MPVVQYVELGYLLYTRYYELAAFLVSVTVISAVLTTAKLYSIRLELFKSIDKQRITPLVHAGRVRSVPVFRCDCLFKRFDCIAMCLVLVY